MRCLSLALLFLAAGCGGRVDDPAPTSTSGSNMPANAPSTTGCAGACDRFRECAPKFDDRDCVSACAREFRDPARAGRFGSCVQAIPCDEVERDLSMDYGPIGECYSHASKP